MDVLVADAARTVWREGELFDAIVTDRERGMGRGGVREGERRREKEGGKGEERGRGRMGRREGGEVRVQDRIWILLQLRMF